MLVNHTGWNMCLLPLCLYLTITRKWDDIVAYCKEYGCVYSLRDFFTLLHVMIIEFVFLSISSYFHPLNH